MLKLTLSLLLVVLLAVVGIGGALDNFFNQYQTHPNNLSDELSAYHQIGKSLAATLNKQSDPQQFITSWQQEKKLTVTLVHLNDFFIPNSLQRAFYAGEPLDFETENNVSIHFIVPAHRQVLIFRIPPIVKGSHQDELQLLLTTVFYLAILVVVLIWLTPLIK